MHAGYEQKIGKPSIAATEKTTFVNDERSENPFDVKSEEDSPVYNTKKGRSI